VGPVWPQWRAARAPAQRGVRQVLMRTWQGDRWYDNTSWEFDTPDDWSVIVDKSIKNWPHKATAPSGTVLTIWVGKTTGSASISRALWEPPLPAWLKSDAERDTYAAAEREVKHFGQGEPRGRRLGNLSGFEFDLSSPPRAWGGYFAASPWWVRARLEPSNCSIEEEHVAAREILGSMRFKELV
jgi:hypothetical protein